MPEHLNFTKYTSIENTYQTPYMEKVRNTVPSDMLWDVTEKVHGANCSIITDGKVIEFAKRTSIVEENEGFFNYEQVLEGIDYKFINAFNYIKDHYNKPVKVIQFYGELFGGYYPHEDVKRDSRFSAVQKGIYYAPYQYFYGFDIAVCTEDSREWLNPDEVSDAYNKNGIFYAKSLFRGTLDECLAFSNMFQSHIPEWLGLPVIEGNTCEGVVLKPMVPQFFKTGERIVLKNKNEKFAEKKKEHVHKEVKDLPEVVVTTSNIMNEYVTDARLCNVISHEGEFDMPKAFGKLIKLFTEDILNDFYKEHQEEWNSLEKGNQKLVTKNMTQLASATIKQHYSIR